MKEKEIERLVRQYLLPTFKGWECRGNILFRLPIGLILCGIGFETSSFDSKLLNVDAFCQPLYLPPSTDSYVRIRRLTGVGDMAQEDEGKAMGRIARALRAQAIPFLQEFDTPERLAALESEASRLKDPYHLEAIALSCAVLGRAETAANIIARAIAVLQDDDRRWCQTMIGRLESHYRDMSTDHAAFRSRLLEWRRKNLALLRLDTIAR